MLTTVVLQVGFLTTFAILLHEIPHEVRWLNPEHQLFTSGLWHVLNVLTVSWYSGGRLCHPTQSWIWPLERRSHAAVHGIFRGFGSVLCVMRSLPGGRRWDGLVPTRESQSSSYAWRQQSLQTFSENATAWILPFTAGGFLYIALVNVVPDLLEESSLRYPFIPGHRLRHLW